MRLTRFLRRSAWDAERTREIEAHLAIETDENVARGMSVDDARAAARRKLGNVTLVREELGDACRRRRSPDGRRAPGQRFAGTARSAARADGRAARRIAADG